jgi:hypothetical protein
VKRTARFEPAVNAVGPHGRACSRIQAASDGDLMPWRDIGKMDDVELSALREYIIHRPEAPASVATKGAR